jgi:hypothetical protein
MKIFYDNQVTRYIAANSVFHERIKYIEVDYHFSREKIQSKDMETLFVKNEDQLADIFIKVLSIKKIENISSKFGLYDVCHPSLMRSVEKYD